jgi:hypothetical protein
VKAGARIMTAADNFEGSTNISGRMTRRRALGLLSGAALGSMLAAFPEPRTATALQGWGSILKAAVTHAPAAAKLAKGVIEGAVLFTDLKKAWNGLWEDGDSKENEDLYNKQIWTRENSGGYSVPRASQDQDASDNGSAPREPDVSTPTIEEGEQRLSTPSADEKVISNGLSTYAPSEPPADTWITLRGTLLDTFNLYTERAARNDPTAALDNAMLQAFLYMQWWLTNAYVGNPRYYQNVRYPQDNYRRFFAQYGNAVQQATPALRRYSPSDIQDWADRFYVSLNEYWKLPQLSYKEAAMFTFGGSLAEKDRKLVSEI